MSVRNENQEADHLVGRLLGERYRLVSLLGTGRSAQVYLADDLSLGRPVAVKRFTPTSDRDLLRRRFRAGIDAVDQLSHPNLLAIHDWGDDAGPYLVTELLLGGSLRDMVDRRIALSPSQGLLVALQVAYGLDHAHDVGWIHGDITPGKLLFGPEGRLRLAGLRATASGVDGLPTPLIDTPVDAVRYAAPERFRGGPIDGSADLYSLVVAIAEAVTGAVPLLGDDAASTVELRERYDIEPLEALGALGSALEPAGRADPAERPTVGELVEGLTAAARTLPRPDRLPLVSRDLDPSARRYLDSELVDTELPERDLAERDRGALTAPPAADIEIDLATVDVGGEPDDNASDDAFLDLDLEGGSTGRPVGTGFTLDLRDGTGPNRSGGAGDGAPPTRRSSDQVAYEPIPRPAPTGTENGTERSLLEARSNIDHADTLRPDEMTVIPRPPARLRPTRPPVADRNGIAESEVGLDPEPDIALEPDIAPQPDIAPELERAAHHQREETAPPAVARRTTSWLDEAKLDPGTRPASNGASPTGAHAPEPVPAPRAQGPAVGRPDQRRPPQVELATPLSLSRVVDEPARPVELPELGEPPIDRWDADPPEVARPAPRPVEARSEHGADDRLSPGSGEIYDYVVDDDDYHEREPDDAGGRQLDPPEPVRPDEHRRSVLAVTDLIDEDVFASAERLARPPEPGRLQPPPPLHRTTSPSSPLPESLRSAIRNLTTAGPPERWATGLVIGVFVVLVIAVLGLRVTGGSQIDASAGTLGAEPSDGAGAATAPVGSYVGSEIEAAQADAAANGWELNTIRVWRDRTTPGQIVEQAPLPGTPLERGGRLDVVVTQGPELISIPPVVGHSADEAADMLLDSGLVVGTITEVESDAAPGSVIGTAVDGPEPSAAAVERGVAIDLILSASVDAVPMPSFVGLTVDQAIAQANELGVELVHGEVASTHWDAGLVADTTPPTDTPIRPGDEVTIYVSTGPPGAEAS